MKFHVSHEVLFEITLEAANQKQAEKLAADTPYAEWEQGHVVREDCVAVADSPLNPSFE